MTAARVAGSRALRRRPGSGFPALARSGARHALNSPFDGRTIPIEAGDFPTDRYLAEDLASFLGAERRRAPARVT